MNLESYFSGEYWPLPGWYGTGSYAVRQYGGRTASILGFTSCGETGGMRRTLSAPTSRLTLGGIHSVRVNRGGGYGNYGNGGFALYSGSTPQITVAFDDVNLVFKYYRGSRASGTLIATSPLMDLNGVPNTFVEWTVTVGTSGARITAYLNNVLFHEVTGLNTDPAGSGTVSHVHLFGASGDTYAGYGLGDAYLLVDAGGSLPERLGVIRVSTATTNQTGPFAYTAWGYTGYDIAGACDDWDISNGVVAPAAAGLKQSVAMTDLPSAHPGDVLSMQTLMLVQETGDGTGKVKAGIVSGGVASLDAATALVLSPGYSAISARRDTDPATGAPWERSAINAVQALLETAD